MDTGLNGRTVIITGGASGQGRAAAECFAAEGANIVVADWNAEGAEATAVGIQKSGCHAVSARVDVSKESDVINLISTAKDAFGTIDVLFNNAGVGFSSRARYTMASVTETPAGDWDSILAINLRGAALCCKHALPVMAEHGGGAIVNNASINALVAMPGADAYTAAKGGIVALTRVLAVEWAKRGIRVNCVCPGGVDTPMIAELVNTRDTRATAGSQVPLGRIADPGEIAAVVMFLASDLASYVTGVILPVDGGWTAQ